MSGIVAAAMLGLALVGCSFDMNLMGGREKCWDDEPPRAATLWRGVLIVDAEHGGRLDTPEGEVIPLLPGALTFSGTDMVDGDTTVARSGDDVTLFGGAGSDGRLVVCAVEENRTGP